MDQPAPDNSKSRRKSFQKQSFARERALDSVTRARPAPIDMPALVAGAVSFGIASRVASSRGARAGSVPAVASAPDRRSVARVVSSGARVRNRRPLRLRGRDAPTRVAAARARARRGLLDAHHEARGEPALHRGGLRRDRRGAPPGERAEARHRRCHLRGTGDPRPVTDGNRDKIELIRAKAIVAKEQAIARAAAERARKTGNKQGARKQDKAPDGSEAWRAPYRSMRRGEVTAVTRAEVEAMMPKPGPSPPGLEHARGLRDADVVLLVEMPECEWCARVRPTWRRLAETFGDAADARAPAAPPPARGTCACARSASSPEDRAWADTHLAARAFPTVIAMPKRARRLQVRRRRPRPAQAARVRRRRLPRGRAVARRHEALRGAPGELRAQRARAQHPGGGHRRACARRRHRREAGVRRGGRRRDGDAFRVLRVRRRAAPVHVQAGARRRVRAPPGGGTRARGVADAASAYYESGAGGPGESAQAAAARLDAAGFGYPAGADEGPRASGAPIAPAAAARSQSARARRSARRWRTSAVGPWSSPTRARGAGTKPPSPKARRWRNWASGLSW